MILFQKNEDIYVEIIIANLLGFIGIGNRILNDFCYLGCE
jgi:hypothetical protein